MFCLPHLRVCYWFSVCLLPQMAPAIKSINVQFSVLPAGTHHAMSCATRLCNSIMGQICLCRIDSKCTILCSSCRYTPRDELCNSIMGQIRRQMHTMSGAQLSVVLRAIALAPR